MSEFEFMRDLPFGQYLPANSYLHRLDPRTRLLITIALITALTFVSSPPGLLVGLVGIFAAWGFARIPAGPVLRGWRTALPFLLILALLQVFFRVGPDITPLVQVRSLVISLADILAGVKLILRFTALIALLGLASSVLSASDVIGGLESLLRPLAVLHFPVHDFVMVVQVTLRFFPLLAQTAERIAKAQASRGADWRSSGNLVQRVRQTLPLMIPLFVTSLRRAETLALAMDARAYGSGPRRTSMIVLRFQRPDIVALLVVAGLVALMVIF